MFLIPFTRCAIYASPSNSRPLPQPHYMWLLCLLCFFRLFFFFIIFFLACFIIFCWKLSGIYGITISFLFHISGSFEVKPYCLSVAAYLLCPELDFSLCTHTHTSPGSMCLNSFFEWEHHSYWLGVHVVPSFYLIDIFKGPISKISKRQ